MLPRKHRLAKNTDFKKVFSKGKGLHSDSLVLKYLPNTLEHSRFGIVVSNKIYKKAVKRNKLKRRLREIIRILLPNIALNKDFVISVKQSVREIGFDELRKEVIYLFSKSNCLLNETTKKKR